MTRASLNLDSPVAISYALGKEVGIHTKVFLGRAVSAYSVLQRLGGRHPPHKFLGTVASWGGGAVLASALPVSMVFHSGGYVVSPNPWLPPLICMILEPIDVATRNPMSTSITGGGDFPFMPPVVRACSLTSACEYSDHHNWSCTHI